jgi:putative DNA primase/helicase
MNKNSFLIYGLSLIEGKYYIGKTEDLDRRFHEHTEGTATIWTKIYPPISKPIVLKYEADIFDENLFFKKYVLQYGLENVRGDIYCQIILSPQDIKHLNKELDSANNSCYSCHQLGHFVSRCPFNSIGSLIAKSENLNQSSSDKSCLVSFDSVQLDFVSDIKVLPIFNNSTKDTILFQALNGSSTEIAYLLHLIADKRWVHHKNTGWWNWDGVKWKIDANEGLLELLHSAIPSLLSEVKMKYSQLRLTDKLVDDLPKKILQIEKLRKKILDGDPKIKIMNQAAWVFRNKDKLDITSLLDTNPDLIGFNNGVFDLSTMSFRLARPEDFISQSTGYDFTPDFPEETREQVHSFLESIMPNTQDRQYMLKLLSTGLLGRNPDELFHIFTGAGRNGKSKLVELLSSTLGDYFDACSSSFLTGKIGDSEQASPQLMGLKKSRIVVSSEPDGNGKLNSTIIKQLSGNDRVTGRKLYGDQQFFKPNFKIILLCNDIPVINTPDQATWMRCRCLNFPTRFVEEPKEQYERKIDKEISKKIPSWKLPFFMILIENYKLWIKEGLEMTPNMIDRTKEYQSESDLVLAWLNDRTENSETNCHTSDLYIDFSNWFYSLCISKKCISHLEFVRSLKQHKNVKRGVWANGCGKQGISNIKLKDKPLCQ